MYSYAGTLQKSLLCPGVTKPQSLHPLTDTQLLLAAGSGLYVYNTDTQAVTHTLREGEFRDVHSSQSHVVALEESKKHSRVHIFRATVPPHTLSLLQAEA